MRALERLTTSYYANDALKLRIWMTEGMVKDSVTASLRAFSKSSYLFDVNKTNQALTELIPLLESRQTIPLIGDMIISISDEIRSQNPTLAYQLINKLGDKSPPAKRERILWEKARVMDLILSHQDSTITLPEELRPLATSLYTMDINSSETITHSTLLGWLNSTSISEANTIEAYENILLEYPTGFYAQLVRQRLESIKNSPL
jgi:hypothetical protein